MSKKIKVQLTDKKSAYVIEKNVYHPGDIFEVDASRFDVACMVKIEEPKKPVKPPVVEEPKEEPVEEPEPTTEASSDVVAAQVAPKVQKRKKP